MSAPALIVGTLTIPLLARLEIEQSYEPLGGEFVRRAISGAATKQETWRKRRITTSGSGWMPSGLDTLDTTATLALACVKPVRVPVTFATRQATLPAERRSDAGATPWGWAILADGSGVSTPITLAGNVATLTAVANAVAYEAFYLPLVTVYAMRPTESGRMGDAGYSWQLVCEEA